MKDMKPVEPYRHLAAIYDQVMAHVDYKQWARYIGKIIQSEYGVPKRVADLASGTGCFLQNFEKRNTQLFATDLSPAMLSEAFRKEELKSIPGLAADFTSLPFKSQSLDVCLILYDSINYLLRDEQVERLFREIDRVLRKPGLFIFDAVSPYVCKTAFRDYYENEELDANIAYRRHSWYDAAKCMQYNGFVLEYDHQIFEEVHCQRIRTLREWKKLLKESPLQLLHTYANFTFRPAHRRAERAHFVCRNRTI